MAEAGFYSGVHFFQKIESASSSQIVTMKLACQVLLRESAKRRRALHSPKKGGGGAAGLPQSKKWGVQDKRTDTAGKHRRYGGGTRT
jgi:hypothetical protein